MIRKSVSKFGDCIVFDVSHSEIRRKTPFDDNGVDRKRIASAQKAIEHLVETYYTRAIQDVKNLQVSYCNLVSDLEHYDDKLNSFILIANDIREQGANFNYHMVTYVGDYLCRFTKRIKACPTQRILDIINIHINALNAILTYKIKGKSDVNGDKILNGLEATLEKFAPDIVEAIHDFRKREELLEQKVANL